jgi:hypothetical protein
VKTEILIDWREKEERVDMLTMMGKEENYSVF